MANVSSSGNLVLKRQNFIGVIPSVVGLVPSMVTNLFQSGSQDPDEDKHARKQGGKIQCLEYDGLGGPQG